MKIKYNQFFLNLYSLLPLSSYMTEQGNTSYKKVCAFYRVCYKSIIDVNYPGQFLIKPCSQKSYWFGVQLETWKQIVGFFRSLLSRIYFFRTLCYEWYPRYCRRPILTGRPVLSLLPPLCMSILDKSWHVYIHLLIKSKSGKSSMNILKS